VDLLNNAKDLMEDMRQLQVKVERNLNQFDKILLNKLSVKYGKVATRKYLHAVLGK